MKKLALILSGILACSGAGYYHCVNNVVPKFLQEQLPLVEKLAPDYINGQVKIGSLNWNGALSIEINDVVVTNDKKRKIAVLPKTIVSLRPWRALFGKVEKAVGRVELVKPEVYLHMNAQEKWNLQTLLKPSDSDETPFYGLALIKNGLLHVSTPQGKWDFGVEATVEGGANPQFDFESIITAGNDKVKLAGLMTTKGVGRMTLASENFALAPYASLAKHYAKVDDFAGSFKDVHLLYTKDKDKIKISGQAALEETGGKVLIADKEQKVSLNGKFTVSDNKVSLKDFLAKLDENKIKINVEADLDDIDHPKAKGNLSAEEISLAGRTAKEIYLPFEADSKLVTINKAGLKYGEGNLTLNATYGIEDKDLAADLIFQNIEEKLADGNESFRANGTLAVLAQNKNDKWNIQAAADTIDFTWQNIKLNRIDFDGGFDGKIITIGHLSALSDEGTLAAKGFVNLDGPLELTGRMADFPVDPFIKMAMGEPGRGLVSTRFAVKGTTSSPEFASLVQFRDVNLMKQDVKKGHGFIAMKNQILTIKGLEAEMEQGKHLVNGSVNLTGADPQLDLTVETQNVRIEPLIAYVAPGVDVTGNVDNLVEVKGSTKNPKIFGEVHAYDGSAMKQLFSKVDGRYSYQDGFLTLKDFVINLFLGKITLNGQMNPDKQLAFELDAKNIDLKKIPIKESDLDLAGLLSAHGKLSGNVDKPYFEGEVNSGEFFINKEKFTNLLGHVKTNIQDVNHLDISFDQPHIESDGIGNYKADLNLNRVARQAKGQIIAKAGDVQGVLKAAKQDYPIKGYMDGIINIAPSGPGSGIQADVEVSKVAVREVPYHKMKFIGRFLKGVVHFDDVILQEHADDLENGIVTVGGNIDLKNKIYNVRVGAKAANPALVTAFMNNPPEVKGEADLDIKFNGPFSMPSGTANLSVKNGSVSGVEFDKIDGKLSLADDNLKVQDFSAYRDVYGIKAFGDVPIDVFRSKNQRKNPEAEMNITVDMNEARLGVLPVLTKHVEWATGETEGKLTIGGTLDDPQLRGNLKISDGNVKVKDLNTVIENINMDADFQGKKLVLSDLSAKLGKGSFKANGSYSPYADESTSYDLSILADKAEFDSKMFKGKISADINIAPQRYRKLNKAEPNKPALEAWRSLVKGNVKFDDVLLNIATVPETGEGNTNLGLDLKLELGPKVHMLNSMMYDIWLKGGLDIKGSTNFPIIEGNIQSEKGTITYLRTHFKLDKAKLTWINPGSFLPNVDLSSKARFSRYNIFMGITGPVEQMELKLTSDPYLEHNTLVRMLTLQRDTATNGDVNSEDVANLATIGLEMAVLGDVELWVKQTLGLDQFRIYTGEVRSGIGFEGNISSRRSGDRELNAEDKNKYNVLVSKYLTNKFLIGYTTSFNGLDRTIFGQYDISKHLNLSYSRSYELDDRPKDWYGLEYNVNF